MKATELRLGNHLIFNKNIGTLASISDMADRDIWYKKEDGMFGVCHIRDIEAIPLTEQWLLDFRYKENDKKFFKKTPYYVEYKGWTPEGFWMLKDIDIPIKLLKYVHRLQNLYFELYEKELTK